MSLSNVKAATSVRFQGWEVRPAERLLLVRGESAAVGSRAFDVLLALVERQGRVVTKSELLDSAWPGLVVEENNVSVQIATLRKVLGAQAISTVAGIGYRLAALPEESGPVDEVPVSAAAAIRFLPHALRLASAISLVGRDADLEALTELIGVEHLVSVIGTGGIGKTSLAKAVLSKRASTWHDVVHWIDLGPLVAGEQLVPLMAKSLGIDLAGSACARDDLISALSASRALVGMDNCEHMLVDVTEFIGRALQGAPGMRWLTTSQAPLHILGEVVYRLEPLGVPEPDTGLEKALHFGAMALLSQRAAAGDRHFALNPANLAVAIDLCRQLDGLPLAIEMAAARVSTLGLAGVHQQLGQRLRLLAGRRDGPTRHHTLRSTFDWSHGLLLPGERKVFRRLEPFRDGFCAAMARQVARDLEDGPDSVDEWRVLEVLSALVDKSLVHRSVDQPGRYFLFESAREYAGERLEEAAETAAFRRRHAHAVAAWFATAQADYARLGDEQWAAQYVAERHNVRAALAWACAVEEPDVLAILVAALVQIDSFVQLQPEIVQCGVPMDVLRRATPSLRAAACLEFSWAHYAEGSLEIGTDLARSALEDYTATGDVAGTYRALAQLVRLYESRPGMLGEAERAWESLRRIDDSQVPLRTRLSCTISNSLFHAGTRTVSRLKELEDIAHRAGFEALAAVCRVHITDELLIESRFVEVVETAQQFMDSGEFRPRVKGLILNNQALALVQLGRIREACDAARAALRALPSSSYVVVDTFALAAARDGRLMDAALMCGYSARVRRERDESPDPAEAAAIAETDVLLMRGLTRERLEDLMQVGAAMSPADVLRMAMPA